MRMTMTILATAALLTAAPAAYAQATERRHYAGDRAADSGSHDQEGRDSGAGRAAGRSPDPGQRGDREVHEADLQGLRASIDANAQAAAALKSEGVTSAVVIAALMSTDGTLTLVTKKS